MTASNAASTRRCLARIATEKRKEPVDAQSSRMKTPRIVRHYLKHRQKPLVLHPRIWLGIEAMPLLGLLEEIEVRLEREQPRWRKATDEQEGERVAWRKIRRLIRALEMGPPHNIQGS